MITVYHLLVSQSERIVWLMEELELPYELKSYPRDPVMRVAHPIFKELHPIGQAPVIQDGEVRLAESMAIAQYILTLYGGGKLAIAPGQPNYADYLYWFHYSNGGLMPQMFQRLTAAYMGADQGPMADMANERMARHFGMVNARLASNDWLAGSQFTAADILCHFPFGTLNAFMPTPLDLSAYPNIRAWLKRVSARPAYQRAMKAAGHESDPAAYAVG